MKNIAICEYSHHKKSLVQGHGRKVKHRRENSLHGRDDKTPMDDELRQGSGALIGSTAMDQQQTDYVTELWDGKIRS